MARCASASPAPGSSARCTRARRGWPGRRSPASPPRRPSARARPRRASAPSGRTPRRRQLATADDVDVVHICTPNHLHARARRARARRTASTSSARSRSRSARAQADELIAAPARAAAGSRTVPFVYRFHPVVREARARVRAGALGAGPPHPRRLPAGLARLRRRRQLARRRRPRRPVARVRRHRLALVRPRRVHDRRPDHRALRPDRRPSSPSARRAAHARAFAVTASRRTASRARGDDRGRGHRRVPHRVRRPGHADRQPGLARPQEPPPPRDRVRARRASRFEQERPETLWLGRRGPRGDASGATRARSAPEAAPLRDRARRAPAGLPRLLRPVRRRHATPRSRRRGPRRAPDVRRRRAQRAADRRRPRVRAAPAAWVEV